ncbi:hypothetical protein Esti_003961 [Eimeria stiedai]
MDPLSSASTASIEGKAPPTSFCLEGAHSSPPPSGAQHLQSKRGSARKTLTPARPSLVRSYSAADPTNDAFTVTHELDFDDWMSTMIGTSQLVLSSSVVALAIYLLFTCPEMPEEGPLLFYFAVFSLSAEFALLLLICFFMMFLRVFCGQARAEYSSALCGIFHRTMEGRGDVPIAYARLSEYDYSLQRMHNPAAVGRRLASPPHEATSVQAREGEQAERNPAERPLLSDRV